MQGKRNPDAAGIRFGSDERGTGAAGGKPQAVPDQAGGLSGLQNF